MSGTLAISGHRIEIRGTVQGVGFRPWVYRLARELGVKGDIRNDASGVVIDAFAGEEVLRDFEAKLREPPSPGRVQTLCTQLIAARPADGFAIEASSSTSARRVSIPPDLATCPTCSRELADPDDRRFGYAFTNCTHCGPRFTIAEDVPYDRPVTTMRAFTLCPDCASEYRDPENRRFHAEPNACPRCGPRLRVLRSDGSEPDGDPLRIAARALCAGEIVAVKGIGGFHLACDASSAAAVRSLRERKRREEKPLAVMVRDLEGAREIAVLSPDEERLLASVEAPIVLVRRRPCDGLALEVAPRNPMVGLLLAYSPLHKVLLDEVKRPLVMTSGNLSEEPIVYRNADALARLRGIADLFLLHDREIATRCDDSVARVVAGRPLLLRRSRGYVPRPIRLARPVRRPVLACGAHLKNTFCIAVDDMAVLGPHIGDLDGPETLASFSESVDRMARFLGVAPEIVAHDLHPAYESTRYALGRAGQLKMGVQHHHAHVASAMAERGLTGRVIGVAFDGTGYGLDGTAWGGEILVADNERAHRFATLRPIPLAGGDQAVREPWRVALALLDDAFGGEALLAGLPLFAQVPPQTIAAVRRMIGARVASPLAHGIGRLFDGIGSLVLGRPRSAYEGQIALEWNLAADAEEGFPYPFRIDRGSDPWTLDLRPAVRAIVGDYRAGRPAAAISASFHETIADATAVLVRDAASSEGNLPVVLTGGCFQNARLSESITARLGRDFQIVVHGEVPPGDGGIALGQAVIADAIARL